MHPGLCAPLWRDWRTEKSGEGTKERGYRMTLWCPILHWHWKSWWPPSWRTQSREPECDVTGKQAIQPHYNRHSSTFLFVRHIISSITSHPNNERKIQFLEAITSTYFLLRTHQLQEVSLAYTTLHMMCDTEYSAIAILSQKQTLAKITAAFVF